MRTITTHEKVENKIQETIHYKDLPVGAFFTIIPPVKDGDIIKLILLKTEMSDTNCPVVASVTEMRESCYKKVGDYVEMSLTRKVYPIKSINIQYSL
jgi:hypothetical protein